MKWIDELATLLVAIGALNWGLVALFKFNLVADTLGQESMATNLVYYAIGAAGLWALVIFLRGLMPQSS
ncbi:MAG: DUF378 domain-containing protein [Candidatus Spechtbacterales bacterium]